MFNITIFENAVIYKLLQSFLQIDTQIILFLSTIGTKTFLLIEDPKSI